jgi:indoleamine 2,3-dioxygenase
MYPPLPRLEDYDVSPVNGFLPSEPPCELLSDAYYAPWENVTRNLHSLLLTKRLRGVVQALPMLYTDLLRGEPEWRRAYSILSIATHAYVWGADSPADVSFGS